MITCFFKRVTSNEKPFRVQFGFAEILSDNAVPFTNPCDILKCFAHLQQVEHSAHLVMFYGGVCVFEQKKANCRPSFRMQS